MRRLFLLVAALIGVDTLLYAVLTPLLPHFAHELGLSKARAGVLVGADAAGALVGGLPGGYAAASLGPRRAVLLGLTLLGLASLGFGFASDFWTLCSARFLQGLSSGFTWAGAFTWLLAAAPRERRGELIGGTISAAVVGQMLGPVVGAAAVLTGRAAVFGALAGLAAFLGAWTLRIESAPAERPSVASLGRALRGPLFLAGLGLIALPALLLGVLSVLGPLRLADAGWGAAAIGAVWLVAGALEAVLSPMVGRVADRRGRLLPVRGLLVVGAAVSLALAVGLRPLAYAPLLVLASVGFGVLFTPAFSLLADGAERVALRQGLAFGLMSAAWAAGAMLGPAAGGAIAAATGDTVPFVISALFCLVTLAAVSASRRPVLDGRASGA